MILRNFRKYKKKSIGTFVFLLFYSLLLVQEVVLNRVLCIKSEGTVNLECTFLNYQCPCQDNWLASSNSGDVYSFKSEKMSALHIPLSETYLARILPSEQKNFNLVLKLKIDIEKIFYFENQECQIHHLLPYIRYLQVIPNFEPHFILLCWVY